MIIKDLCTIVNDSKKSGLKYRNSRFQQIMEYFQFNMYLNEVYDLKSMAEYFGFSKKHLIKLFKENLGMTPYQYLISKKMQRAEEILCNTDLPVKTIASMLNYDSYSFMRLFKQRTGMTPSQYRKALVSGVKPLYNYTDDIHKND